MKALLKKTFILVFGAVFIGCESDDEAGIGPVSTSDSAYLYATSNNGDVTRFNINNNESGVTKFETAAGDAEGIFYDEIDRAFTLVSRSSNRLEKYAGIPDNDPITPVTLNLETSGSNDLKSPRDLAVNGSFYVVADNADVDGDEMTDDGRLYIYRKTASGFELRNRLIVDFKVWGITFIDNDLYAVVDESNKLAVFTDFLTRYTVNSTISASKTIAIEGLVRTHGLHYNGDTMVMTDIGDADTDNDGGFHVIKDFQNKFNAVLNGGELALNQQMRVAGDNTNLGNPVDVFYNENYDTVFIAENSNGDGRILGFTEATSSSGNKSPVFNANLAGASSVYFYTN